MRRSARVKHHTCSNYNGFDDPVHEGHREEAPSEKKVSGESTGQEAQDPVGTFLRQTANGARTSLSQPF